jgi:molybdate transport system regulatory protein
MKTDVDGRFWLNVNGKEFLGQGRIALLEQIHATGSISAAARAMGMSYKAAWDAVDAMNTLADQPLLIRRAGGRRGGGSQLTGYAQRVVRQYQAAASEHQRFMLRMGERLQQVCDAELPTDTAYDLPHRRGATMRTSVRNQLPGTVVCFSAGAVNDVVMVDIGDGGVLSALITHEAAQSLELLRKGRVVQVLIAPSSVIVCEHASSLRLSVRNRLCGTVSRIRPGAVSAEVGLDLGSGRALTAMVGVDALHEGWLRTGAEACALIDAAHVMLAVTD